MGSVSTRTFNIKTFSSCSKRSNFYSLYLPTERISQGRNSIGLTSVSTITEILNIFTLCLNPFVGQCENKKIIDNFC